MRIGGAMSAKYSHSPATCGDAQWAIPAPAHLRKHSPERRAETGMQVLIVNYF